MYSHIKHITKDIMSNDVVETCIQVYSGNHLHKYAEKQQITEGGLSTDLYRPVVAVERERPLWCRRGTALKVVHAALVDDDVPQWPCKAASNRHQDKWRLQHTLGRTACSVHPHLIVLL